MPEVQALEVHDPGQVTALLGASVSPSVKGRSLVSRLSSFACDAEMQTVPRLG